MSAPISPLAQFPNETESCPDRARMYRFIGMQSLKEADPLNIVRIVLPDVLVLIISLLCFLSLRYIGKRGSHQGSQETQVNKVVITILFLRML